MPINFSKPVIWLAQPNIVLNRHVAECQNLSPALIQNY